MKISKQTLVSVVVLGAVIALAHISPALATEDPEWANNTAEGFGSLQAVLVTIGSSLIGVAIIGFGLSVCMAGGHIDFRKLGGYLFAGFLVGAGPAAMAWWVALNQASGS